jgi:type 1 glutamine amidotransferase
MTATPQAEHTPRRVLLFGGGEVHDFRACCPVLQQYLAAVPEFVIDDVREDYDAFLAERLAPYDLLVLYQTGGTLSVEQKRGLVEWVASGKGFVGVHAATCCFMDSPEYLAMVGGAFRAHPFERDYIVSLTTEPHPVIDGLPGYTVEHWERWPVYEYLVHDEQYLIDYDTRVHVLATTLFRGARWPVAWVKPWGKGKVFYLALGHNEEACRNPFFQDIFTRGARWAADGAPYEEPPTRKFAID